LLADGSIAAIYAKYGVEHRATGAGKP